MSISIEHFLVVSAVLFGIGLWIALSRLYLPLPQPSSTITGAVRPKIAARSNAPASGMRLRPVRVQSDSATIAPGIGTPNSVSIVPGSGMDIFCTLAKTSRLWVRDLCEIIAAKTLEVKLQSSRGASVGCNDCRIPRDGVAFGVLLESNDPSLRNQTSLMEPATIWTDLEQVIAERKAAAETRKSYVATLLAGGVGVIGAKVVEEAAEVVEAAGETGDDGRSHLVREAADLVFHTLVLLAHREVGWAEVEAELARRFGVGGHVEKAARTQPEASNAHGVDS